MRVGMSVAVETACVKANKGREDGSFGVFCWSQFSMLKRGWDGETKGCEEGTAGLDHKVSFEH